MKNKRPLIYLAIVVASAIAVLFIERPEKMRVNDVSEGFFIPEFDSAKIVQVEINQLIDSAVLKRDGEKWLVSENITPLKKELIEKEGRAATSERWYRADELRVSSALGSFGALEKGVVVSKNPDKRALYQVDAAGLDVNLIDADNKSIVHVIIGKNGPDLASSYVRKKDEDTVYLVRRPITGAFSPRAKDWRERKIIVYDPKDIASIKIESPKGSWQISRGDNGAWQLDEPKGKIDAAKADDAAKKLSDIRAAGFPEDLEKISLSGPKFTLSITDVKGKTTILEIYNAVSDGQYPAKIKGDEEIYFLKKEFVDTIPLLTTR